MHKEKNNFKILLFFITFLTIFLIGYFSSYKIDILDIGKNVSNIENNFKSKIVNNLIEKDLDLDLFWRVYSIVENNYYSSGEVDKKDLEYGVITGFIDSLGDRFSEFLTPEETKTFMDNLSGDFEGIGAVIEKHDLGIIIDRVLAGSPALKGGVLKGDIVVEANEVELKDLSVREAVEYIKGPASTKVTLKIIRNGESDFIYKDILRDKITIPSVELRDIGEDNIGYISLNMFGEHTSREFKNKLNQVKNNENIEGLIIDLRDNGGGYLQSALEITSEFLDRNKSIVTTKYKDNIMNNDYKSINSGNIFDKKLVILINGNSASASEIMSGALSDHRKAILIGNTTYGKGSVQQPFELSDGSLLKLTIAKWYTPSGHSIEENGIKPDIEVNFEREDYENLNDRQLNTAIEVMKIYIEEQTPGIVIEKFNTQDEE